MNPLTQLLLLAPALGALAFVFGRNAYKGVRTGAVWTRGTRYVRDEEPFLFWIAVGFSTTFAALMVVGTAISIWAFVTLG